MPIFEIMKKFSLLLTSVFVTTLSFSQTTLYVNPNANNSNADGSMNNPYSDIASTVDLVEAAGGGNVVVLDGEYEMTNREVVINTAATKSTAVTIKPQSAAGVKFNFNGRFGFEFSTSSNYITLDGFELDGETDEIDYWDIVALGFWGDESIARNGGLAIILDGQNITIKNNYIHDWYQKAVEIRDARYALVQGNIIHDIATTSLSGGHGIMRQQKGQEFFDDDKTNTYRWDISENLIFNVEQRIYSWVPSKGFIEMVIDEGKSILIDDPKDSDGKQEHMSARIKNNIVAFGAVDHIRLKSTPNLEVSHNSIYAFGPNADGITDKQGDSNTPQFTNFICKNNATQTLADISAIEIDMAVEQTLNDGGTPEVSGNYAMDGRVKPNGQTGITALSGGNLFTAPKTGNFRINPSLGLPANTGVETLVLDEIEQKTTLFNVTVAPNANEVNHLKLTQTILDNIPGLNDGVNGNENVFEDNGEMSGDYHTITYNVVNGEWKDKTGSKGKQKFELNEAYYTWYQSVATTHTNSQAAEYERIRWGDSEIKQNQAFNPNWLTVTQIKDGWNSLINAPQHNVNLDGDLLIDFENYTPQLGEQFDLILAKTITSNNAEGIFKRILFEGHTPSEYELKIIDLEGYQVLRLGIGKVNSVKTLNENAISISPNPFANSISINHYLGEIEVFTLAGKQISCLTQKANNSTTINTSNWHKGVYIIKTKNQAFRVVKL